MKSRKTKSPSRPLKKIRDPIFCVLNRGFDFLDGSSRGKSVFVKAGRYELERIKNPFGHKARWLVLKGTSIGGSETSWRQWKPTDKPTDFSITFDDGIYVD